MGQQRARWRAWRAAHRPEPSGHSSTPPLRTHSPAHPAARHERVSERAVERAEGRAVRTMARAFSRSPSTAAAPEVPRVPPARSASHTAARAARSGPAAPLEPRSTTSHLTRRARHSPRPRHEVKLTSTSARRAAFFFFFFARCRGARSRVLPEGEGGPERMRACGRSEPLCGKGPALKRGPPRGAARAEEARW